jgi:hypothetical protein
MSKVPFCPILPESKAPPSATTSCVVVSVLDHVTLPPTEIVTGFGTYAAEPKFRALAGIVTVVDAAVVGVVGVVGVVMELPPPQLTITDTRKTPIPMRTAIMLSPNEKKNSSQQLQVDGHTKCLVFIRMWRSASYVFRMLFRLT